MTSRKTYRIRLDFLDQKRLAEGWDALTLALNADIDPGTLAKIYRGEGVSMKVVQKLAALLSKKPADLIIPDGAPAEEAQSVQQRSIEVILTIKGGQEDLEELTRNLSTFIESLCEVLRNGARVFPISVDPGSIILTVKANNIATESLITQFCLGGLKSFRIYRLSVKGDVDVIGIILASPFIKRRFTCVSRKKEAPHRQVHILVPKMSGTSAQALQRVGRKLPSKIEIVQTSKASWKLRSLPEMQRSRTNKL